MYIVLIAWLYVTLLMAASEPGWVAGVLTFVAYGLIPGSLFWWLFGGRRQFSGTRRLAGNREPTVNSPAAPNSLPDQMPDEGH